MSVTDELRSLLDEHGIEWWYDPNVSPDHTEWMTDRMVFTSLGFDGDMLAVKTISKMTPEQAIAATVGRGTCHMTLYAAGNDYARYTCSECERETMVPCVVEGVSRDYEPPRYCVNCGREVVE